MHSITCWVETRQAVERVQMSHLAALPSSHPQMKPCLCPPELGLAVSHPGGTGHQMVLGSVACKGWEGLSALLLSTVPSS